MIALCLIRMVTRIELILYGEMHGRLLVQMTLSERPLS